jgi:hypothetical protein
MSAAENGSDAELMAAIKAGFNGLLSNFISLPCTRDSVVGRRIVAVSAALALPVDFFWKFCNVQRDRLDAAFLDGMGRPSVEASIAA